MERGINQNVGSTRSLIIYESCTIHSNSVSRCQQHIQEHRETQAASTERQRHNVCYNFVKMQFIAARVNLVRKSNVQAEQLAAFSCQLQTVDMLLSDEWPSH